MSVALMLVDIQKGVIAEARNNPDMETNALTLLEAWRAARAPVVHVQHASTDPASPLAPERPGYDFRPGFEPQAGERHVIKSQSAPFAQTGLADDLRAERIEDLVIAGVCTEHCVSSTARAASNLGFRVTIVGDACHAWSRRDPMTGRLIPAEDIHRMELAILSGEYADVVTARDAVDLALVAEMLDF